MTFADLNHCAACGESLDPEAMETHTVDGYRWGVIGGVHVHEQCCPVCTGLDEGEQ